MIKHGITLFNVMEDLLDDFEGTIRAVAAAGAQTLEVSAGIGDEKGEIMGIPVREFQDISKELGISFVSTFNNFLGSDEEVDIAIHNTAAIGGKDVVLALNFLDENDVFATAELANRLGKKVKDAGLTMLYHNHFHEWRVRNGKYLMDMFYDATDPELVSFEYDTFWAARGGVDPLAYLKKMGKRVKIIHLKDMAATANPVNLVPLTEGMSNFLSFVLNDMDKSDFVEVGGGALDMKGLVKEGIDLGVDAIIVEQDNTKLEPLESVRVSMKNLKAILASL